MLDGNSARPFSCSCPSDYSPCKHIGIIKDEIENRISKTKNDKKEKTLTIEEVLKNVPHEELVDFIVRQSKYDLELSNSIFLEFLHKADLIQENKYSIVLRNALKKVDVTDNDLHDYYDSAVQIDIMDEWLTKAKTSISEHKFDEAIAICKACIEEYAEWIKDMDDYIIENIDPCYFEFPFDYLREIITIHTFNTSELFDYCKKELFKSKYEYSYFQEGFNNLMLELSKTDQEIAEFIHLQDELLKKIIDKNSYDAKRILERKITIFNNTNQPEKAKQLIIDNLQIESFRMQVVEEKIKKKEFKEAKKLIADFLNNSQNNSTRYTGTWHELALSIAQMENDIPEIRKISYSFIEKRYQKKYYDIYKETFNSEDWKVEVEKLLSRYDSQKTYFKSSVADIFKEENETLKLMKYIEKHLSTECLSQYYCHFSEIYPKETLELFRKVLSSYIENNMGRTHYEYTAKLLRKMTQIDGGKDFVRPLIERYKTQYKTRRAMIEILNAIKLG